MIVEVIIAVLAAALAAVTVVAAVVGLLGVTGVAVIRRCPGCRKFALQPRAGRENHFECAHCRHPHLTHPVRSLRHPVDAVLHH